MARAIQNRIITVVGQKGYGKTTLTEKIIIGLNKPTIIADPRQQYNDDPKRRVLFRSVASFKQWIKANYGIFKRYKLELIVDVTKSNFNELATLVSKMEKVTFLIDEVDLFTDALGRKDDALDGLIHYGRHNQIDLVTTSRRPANISRNLTSQTDFFYLSRLAEPNDTKYFKQKYGNDIIPILQNLPKYEFLQVDDENNKKRIITTSRDVKILS
jgi:hypothetical protein